MSKATNIRMSGLGGQGVVTAAHILGSAATAQGFESTVNPFFGAEKRLAPAESHVRISKERIYERGEILKPNIIMIFHPDVITKGKCYTMPFFDGLQKEGTIIINSEKFITLKDDDLKSLSELNVKIFYLPATEIALEIGGTELATNMAMLGALLGVTGIVSFDNFKQALSERFSGGKFVASATTAALDDALKAKYSEVAQLLEKNMKVAEAASKSIKEYIIA